MAESQNIEHLVAAMEEVRQNLLSAEHVLMDSVGLAGSEQMRLEMRRLLAAVRTMLAAAEEPRE